MNIIASESEPEGDIEGDETNEEDSDVPRSTSEGSEDPRSFLLQYAIQVDPVYKLVVCIEPDCQTIFRPDNIYNHKVRKHYQNTNRTLRTGRPSSAGVRQAILTLGGFDPSPPLEALAPIQPIAGVKIKNGKKCTMDDCQGCVFGNDTSLATHQQSCHPYKKGRKRSSMTVKCQSLNAVMRFRSYVEVIPPTLVNTELSEIDLFLQAAEVCNLLGHNELFDLASSDREKCAVFAQSHWDEMIEGVNIRDLIQTAKLSEQCSNTAFAHLRELVVEYYQDLVPEIDKAPVLTRRYLLTAQ